MGHLNQIRQEYLKAYRAYTDITNKYLSGSEKISRKLFNQYRKKSEQTFNTFYEACLQIVHKHLGRYPVPSDNWNIDYETCELYFINL